METITAHNALYLLTGREGRKHRLPTAPHHPAPDTGLASEAMSGERFWDMGMEQEALVKVVGMLALGSDRRLPLTCADCLVKVGLLRDTENQQRFWGWEKASALQGGPSLPAGTHQHFPWPNKLVANRYDHYLTQFMARPGGKMLLPGVCREPQVEIFENLFLPRKFRHLTSYPILCPCLF